MFQRRGVLIHPHELSNDWLNTMQAMHINVLGLHPPGGREADQHLMRMLEMLKTPEMRGLLDRAVQMGMTIEYEMHAMSYLIPRSMLVEHPDWFRMNAEGERVADFNLCASSREALDFLSERSAQLAAQLPTATHRYYFWMDDVKNTSCHCPRCRELSPSDQQMICVNAILRGIKTVDPLAKLAYIAYQDTLQVPTQVKPDKGVFLEYAPIQRRMDRPLWDCDCEENRRESRSVPDLLRFFGTEDAQVLEYWLDNSLFSNWKYPPQPFTLKEAVMRQDVQDYRRLGFPSVTTFACFLGEDYIRLHGKPDIAAYGEALYEE